MRSFIFDVLKELKSKKHVISELTFILPSKRAGLFLKKSWRVKQGCQFFT